jgi:alcohol dehydrogenase class IV
MPPIKPFEFATATRIATQLQSLNLGVTRFRISGEPDIATIEAGVEAARSANADVVIGIGGGSALDTGKAIAALIANGGSVLDYVEVVGRGQPLTKASAPYIAMPTTAGTGSEVTRNSVISIPDQQVKVSMRSPLMLPRVALIDPELTYNLPPEITASTGLDTLTQLIEAYTCIRPNPITDTLIISGLQKTIKSLPLAYKGNNPQARDDMAYAAMISGIALANAGLGAVHGLGSAIGGRYPIPHGVCCAILLPHVVGTNIKAIKEREPLNMTNIRYAVIANMTPAGKDKGNLAMENFQNILQEMVDGMNIPRLSTFGVTADAIPELVEQSRQANSMKANPIALTDAELSGILTAALA